MKTTRALNIRRLGVQQAVDYRTVRLNALKNAPDAFGSSYDAEAARPLVSFIERLESSSVFGAYDGGTIVGTARFTQEAGPKDRHKGFLNGMYVDPTMHRCGVGSALVDAVLDQAASAVEQVMLKVVATNIPAIALYKRKGFEPYGIEPHALKSDDQYFDEMLMVRFIRAPL